MSIIYLTPLIIIQFYSSPSDFINKQLDDDEAKVFRLTADIVRTTGTFSFTAGQTTLLAMLGSFTLAGLTAKNILFTKKWMPSIIFFTYAILVILSGSRAALTTFGFQFCIYIILAIFFTKKNNRLQTISLLMLSILMLVILPYIFSTAIDATTERIMNANDSEVLSDRIIIIFFGDPELYENFNWIGYGIGAGTNFVGTISNTDFALGETETSRVMLEGGVLGFIFVFVKSLTVLFGLSKSIKVVRLNGNPFPFLIWITIALALFTWSIIGQLTVNALGFLLLGIGVFILRSDGKAE
jgi:hypothetical protein